MSTHAELDRQLLGAAGDRDIARARELLRAGASMPQAAAARRAGIDRRNWARIEAGAIDPRLETLLKIQYALGVDSLDALFGETTGDILGRQAPD